MMKVGGTFAVVMVSSSSMKRSAGGEKSMEKEYYDELEMHREVLAKITADREVFRNIIDALDKKDVKRFQEILKGLDLLPLCERVCETICRIVWAVKCSISCRWVCKDIPMRK